MLIYSGSLSIKKLLTKPTLYTLKGLLSLLLLLFLSTGCSKLQSPIQQLPSLLPGIFSQAKFQVSVIPSDNQGRYTLEGKTNLPDKSRITVAAVRYLRPASQLSPSLSSQPTYSILDYKDVKVNKGQWETQLNLWKIAPDGQFRETWQLDEAKLGLSLDPVTEVTFLATFAPTDPLAGIEQQLKKQGIEVESNLVYNTPDGQRYIQASQILPIPLPTGQTKPPQQQPEDINGGWGPRYLLLPEPPNINRLKQPGERRTDAPLSPSEFLQ